MKKLRIILNTLLLVLALGSVAPQFAQDVSTGHEKPDPVRRSIAIGLVRTINTAEVTERARYGSYASWETILTHEQHEMNQWVASVFSRDPNVHFGSTPEILPGWNLRLIVPPDGTGWVVVLEDANDKAGYAALSDESGVIRECRYIE